MAERSSKRKLAIAASGLGVLGIGVGGYVLQRATVRRWRLGEAGLAEAGRSLPDEVEHHFIPTSDGGKIHAIAMGRGQPILLVHGVTLGVAVWATQFRALCEKFLVVAIDQRGHGLSRPGEDGFSFDRLAQDLKEVIDKMKLKTPLVVGHSMGGMVAQLLALDHPESLGDLLLLSTAAGPILPQQLRSPVTEMMVAGTVRSLSWADHQGRRMIPSQDLGSWITRAAFGKHPSPPDLELTRSMVESMSPGAMAGLMGPLLTFDIRHRIDRIRAATTVVVGSRDLLTPPTLARTIARRIPGAELVVLPGCGHMVMLERADELNDLITQILEGGRGRLQE